MLSSPLLLRSLHEQAATFVRGIRIIIARGRAHDSDGVQGNWKHFKGKVQEKWAD
jgi:hypothetical protein